MLGDLRLRLNATQEPLKIATPSATPAKLCEIQLGDWLVPYTFSFHAWCTMMSRTLQVILRFVPSEGPKVLHGEMGQSAALRSMSERSPNRAGFSDKEI